MTSVSHRPYRSALQWSDKLDVNSELFSLTVSALAFRAIAIAGGLCSLFFGYRLVRFGCFAGAADLSANVPTPVIIAADLEAALDGARSALARSVSGGWLERVPVPGEEAFAPSRTFWFQLHNVGEADRGLSPSPSARLSTLGCGPVGPQRAPVGARSGGNSHNNTARSRQT
jgi:hypothetical protein